MSAIILCCVYLRRVGRAVQLSSMQRATMLWWYVFEEERVGMVVGFPNGIREAAPGRKA